MISKGKEFSIKFCKLIKIRKSFINTRNRIEESVKVEDKQTNHTERTDGKKNTTAEAAIGGARPIS
jgi:hypothetical protein